MKHFFDKKAFAASALIWLITILFVAAAISAFFYASMASLQQSSMSISKKGVHEVSSALFTIKIWAEDGSNSNLTDFCWKFKHFSPGDPVSLDGVLLEVDTLNESSDLLLGLGPMVWDPTEEENGTLGYWTNETTGRGYFSFTYLVNGSSHRDGVMSYGDIAKVCFRPARGLTPDEDVLLQLVLKDGWSLGTPITIPYFSKPIVDIFPISDGTP